MKLADEIKFGELKGFGKLGLDRTSGATPTDAIQIFSKFISSVIGVITIVAALWFVFVFVSGAISWISAGGDKNLLESAKKKITTGILGLAITVIAIFIIRLVTQLIGIPDILDLVTIFGKI